MTRPNTMRLGIHKAENESEAHAEPLKKLRQFKAPERQEPRPTESNWLFDSWMTKP